MNTEALPDNVADFPGQPPEDCPQIPMDMVTAIAGGAPFALFVWTYDEGTEKGGFKLQSNIPPAALGIGLGQYLVTLLQENAAIQNDRAAALRVIEPFAALADRIGVTELVQHPAAPIPGHLFHNAKVFVDAIKPPEKAD